MAFDITKMTQLTVNDGGVTKLIWGYTTAVDALATVAASAYFNDFDNGSGETFLNLNDLIYVSATDGRGFYYVSSVDTPITISALSQVTQTLANTNIFVGNGSNAPVAVAVSGDATLANTGALTIANNAVTSAKLAETTIKYAEVTISSAEVLALRATPKALVAAPGAGKVLEFVSLELYLDYNAAAYVESAANMAVKYNNGAGVAVSQTIEATGFIDQTADTRTNGIPRIDSIVAKAGCENQALVLHNTGAGEYTTGNSPIRAKIAYRVHTTGW